MLQVVTPSDFCSAVTGEPEISICRRGQRHPPAPAGRANQARSVSPCAAQNEALPVRLAIVAVRTAGDPRSLVKAISHRSYGPSTRQPLTNVHTMDGLSMRPSPSAASKPVTAVFAAVAVALGSWESMGAGVLVSQAFEVGIRVALGAPPSAIVGLVLGGRGG